jgi:hypothetical protein
MAKVWHASEGVRGVVLGLWALSLGWSALAAETPLETNAPAATHRVVVPKLGGAVKMDGELNEAVWAKAAVIKDFCRADGSGAAREATELRLWYDDQALYLGWTCQDTNIQATFTNRDSPLFEEEAVELFVTPNELARYFEFEWNPLGAVFDAVIHNELRTNGSSKGFHGDWAYTAKTMQSAAKLKGRLNHSAEQDEFWQVEVRLPFADLGFPAPRPREVWRMNAFRINRTRGLRTEFLSWSPTFSRSFHEPKHFGYLEFGK